jgi:hypothetical protein
MNVSRHLVLVAGITTLLVGATGSTLAVASTTPHADQGSARLLQFDTMFADVPPFIGATGHIRGIDAAPLPWMIHAVHGELDANGRLVIDVDGLVLADQAPVPPSLQGTNPIPFFAGVVSCLTSVNGSVGRRNVITANFPASMPGGFAHIHQVLTLPQPCVAPVVFVTSPGPTGEVWFTVSGN